jgi:hypothetical protein
LFAVKEGRGNPNFIGDFDLGKNLRFRKTSMRCIYIRTKYYTKFQVNVKRDLLITPLITLSLTESISYRGEIE